MATDTEITLKIHTAYKKKMLKRDKKWHSHVFNLYREVTKFKQGFLLIQGHLLGLSAEESVAV